MHSFSIIAVLATAAVVTMAAPNATTAGGFKNYTNGNTCGNRHKKACCNGAEGVAVIGAKCSLLNSVGGVCNGGNVQCCKVDETGALSLLNLCVPIQL
ncbi:hypothetical protein LTR09_003554 [Extremus antarcticus]|uniref:Hydrophobin n=1 Tax=Extremus antarcticus TaxID=702011 RepID=A0AAJ0DK38_9PEZI|nr:hypothetical protein LTR09_003554 [Extremus antarcticus]